MSITFWAPDAPKEVEEYPCFCADEGDPHPDCWECKGSGVVTFDKTRGEFNVSNVNGKTLLRFLSLEPECCGEWAVDKMPALRSRVDQYLNHPQEANERASDLWGAEYAAYRGPGFIQGYLMALRSLADIAEESNCSIVWG